MYTFWIVVLSLTAGGAIMRLFFLDERIKRERDLYTIYRKRTIDDVVIHITTHLIPTYGVPDTLVKVALSRLLIMLTNSRECRKVHSALGSILKLDTFYSVNNLLLLKWGDCSTREFEQVTRRDRLSTVCVNCLPAHPLLAQNLERLLELSNTPDDLMEVANLSYSGQRVHTKAIRRAIKASVEEVDRDILFTFHIMKLPATSSLWPEFIRSEFGQRRLIRILHSMPENNAVRTAALARFRRITTKHRESHKRNSGISRAE